ncbi:MAG: hypothetical protein HGA45_35355 [Chloroflexales bacterium]|nr:hypothetical protein [Chloroflexales bacterium]
MRLRNYLMVALLAALLAGCGGATGQVALAGKARPAPLAAPMQPAGDQPLRGEARPSGAQPLAATMQPVGQP